MSEFFDGSPFTFEECFNEQFEVHRKTEGHKNYRSVVEGYEIYKDWWENTKQVFNGCFKISSDTGFACSILSHKEGHGYDGYQRQFLSCPAAFRSFGVWALYQTIKNSELDFIDRCKTPRNEEALTAKLTEVISSNAEKIQEKYEKFLFITDSYLNLSEVELQVQRREKQLGADFGFLLEWRDEKGVLNICPIIFQAKRTESEVVDISRSDASGEAQIYKLNRSKANPAYMFYHCSTQSTTTSPRIVSVKKVGRISSSGDSKKTSAVEGVLSLSSFFLEIISGQSDCRIFSDRLKALSSILNTIAESELYAVFSLSVDPNIGVVYREEYKKYLNYIKNRANEVNKKGNDESSIEP